MPRLKCRFCNNHIKVKPIYIEDETYYCRCYKCANSTPPDDWRCQGEVTTNGINRNKGDRCKQWVSRVGDKYCHNHKGQVKE